MKKLIVLLIFIFTVLVFFHFFKISTVDNAIGNTEFVLVKKTKNPNRFSNLLLPNPRSFFKVGDNVLVKDISYQDKTYRKLKNVPLRLYGKPGEIISVSNKNIYDANKNVISLENTKLYFKYRISFNNPCNCEAFLKDYNVKLLQSVADNIACDIIASVNQADEILNHDNVVAVREDKILRGTNSKEFFPKGMFYNWNKDYFGPIAIPEKDLILVLNERNIELYRELISRFEGNRLVFNLKSININDVETDKYQVKKNYYFFISDNRDEANDSRKWGFIPEDYIEGKIIW